MEADEDEVRAADGLLWPGEVPELTAKQRRIGPGGSVINPTTVIATNKRIIIINRVNMGIRKDYEVIPYRQVTSVRLEHGLIASSVFIRVQGYDIDKGLLKNGKQEGEIDGLNNKVAEELADLINKHVEGGVEEGPAEQMDTGVGAYRYCSKCGAKNDADAKFCEKCGTKLE